jgi:hypothetical protein
VGHDEVAGDRVRIGVGLAASRIGNTRAGYFESLTGADVPRGIAGTTQRATQAIHGVEREVARDRIEVRQSAHHVAVAILYESWATNDCRGCDRRAGVAANANAVITIAIAPANALRRDIVLPPW